jgi:hypothetical protein
MEGQNDLKEKKGGADAWYVYLALDFGTIVKLIRGPECWDARWRHGCTRSRARLTCPASDGRFMLWKTSVLEDSDSANSD